MEKKIKISLPAFLVPFSFFSPTYFLFFSFTFHLLFIVRLIYFFIKVKRNNYKEKFVFSLTFHLLFIVHLILFIKVIENIL